MAPRFTEEEFNKTIHQGTVYYFQDRRLTSPESHYFVVINRNPTSDELIALLVTSSKVEKVKAYCERFRGTYVELSPNDYKVLSTNSIIDCNSVFPFAKTDLLKKINTESVKLPLGMPKSIMDKILKAVKQSPKVEEVIKKLL